MAAESTGGMPFEAAWAVAERIPGWLTVEQGRALWDAALQLGPGDTVLEIGSHQGRSTVVLGSAARSVGAGVVAVDPFIAQVGGPGIRKLFERNIADAGLAGVIELVSDYSTRLRPRWHRPVQLVFVDGKHDFWTASDDLRWSAFLPEGAVLLVHDAFSSVGVTLALFARVAPGRRLRYAGRTGSLAMFRVGRPEVRDRLRMAGEIGWFLRNVAVKVLLRLRLYPATRIFCHRERVDPY